MEATLSNCCPRHSHVQREREPHRPGTRDALRVAPGPVFEQQREARHLVRPASGMLDHKNHRHAGEDVGRKPVEEAPGKEVAYYDPGQMPAAETLYDIGGVKNRN